MGTHRLQVKREVNIDSATLGVQRSPKENFGPGHESLQSCLDVGSPMPRRAELFKSEPGKPLPSSRTIRCRLLIFLSYLVDEPQASPRFDAVADGVLDQRLKNESRNQGFHEFTRNGLFQSKPFAKTLLLNAHICPNKFELLRQGNLLFLHRIKRATQQLA